MVKQRKICIVTGTRAEYGLLKWVMKEIELLDEFQLQVIATGMHLSPEFGLTYKQIEADGFYINKKVEMLLSSDTAASIGKSMGLALVGFSDAFTELDPDLVVVLGDRFEIFSAAASATIARIPIAHLHGGESTEGAFDESLRHSISKMSHIHFTATEEYRSRVIQLGEHPNRVFNVGAPGIDSIKRLKLLPQHEVEQKLGLSFSRKNLLVTFHPVTLESSTAEKHFYELLQAIDILEDTSLIFTKPNADTDSRVICKMIDGYVADNPGKAAAFTSLGQPLYLSTVQYMDGVVGNSSSGLIEVPSFKVGTINIGDRQLGRIKAESVIDCEPNRHAIGDAITALYSRKYQMLLKTVVNPYGVGRASEQIVEILREFEFSDLIKKSFYNINQANQ